MRLLVTPALFLALAGCGGEASAGSEADRCVDRLLSGPEVTQAEGARSYVRRTYCEPFARRGWVYEDGALNIDAQLWLEESGSESCGSEGSETIPCVELRENPEILDCALLRHVRRSEVRSYLARLRHEVKCDDGTPMEQLGVP